MSSLVIPVCVLVGFLAGFCVREFMELTASESDHRGGNL